VERDHQQQSNTQGPDEFGLGLEEMAVFVYHLRPKENLEIAEHVADNEEKERQAAHGHDVLLSQRGFK
jgi:hypothetical protein